MLFPVIFISPKPKGPYVVFIICLDFLHWPKLLKSAVWSNVVVQPRTCLCWFRSKTWLLPCNNQLKGPFDYKVGKWLGKQRIFMRSWQKRELIWWNAHHLFSLFFMENFLTHNPKELDYTENVEHPTNFSSKVVVPTLQTNTPGLYYVLV